MLRSERTFSELWYIYKGAYFRDPIRLHAHWNRVHVPLPSPLYAMPTLLIYMKYCASYVQTGLPLDKNLSDAAITAVNVL